MNKSIDQLIAQAKELPSPLTREAADHIIDNAALGGSQLVKPKTIIIMITLTTVAAALIFFNQPNNPSPETTVPVVQDEEPGNTVETIGEQEDSIVFETEIETTDYVEIESAPKIIVQADQNEEPEIEEPLLVSPLIEEEVDSVPKIIGHGITIKLQTEFTINAATTEAEMEKMIKVAAEQGINMEFFKLKRKKGKVTKIGIALNNKPPSNCVKCSDVKFSTTSNVDFEKMPVKIGWRYDENKELKQYYFFVGESEVTRPSCR